MKKITFIIMIMGVLTISNAQIEKKETLDTDSVPKRIGLLKIFRTNAQVNNNEIFSKDSVQRNELKLTPEITEMLDTSLFLRIKNLPDGFLSTYGVTSRSQLENLYVGKPIPEYWINTDNENLIFTGKWRMPVMSDVKPLFIATIKLADDGQYRYSESGKTAMAEILHDYEHKDLIIGCIQVSFSGMEYLIIRKEDRNSFVKVYDETTHELFKECSLSEIINFLKE